MSEPNCPKCDESLEDATLELLSWTPNLTQPTQDADLLLTCGCGARFNAFIPFTSFNLLED